MEYNCCAACQVDELACETTAFKRHDARQIAHGRCINVEPVGHR